MTKYFSQYEPFVDHPDRQMPKEARYALFIYDEAKRDAPKLMDFLNSIDPEYQIDNLSGVMCELLFLYYSVVRKDVVQDKNEENERALTVIELILVSLAENDPDFEGSFDIREFHERDDIYRSAQYSFIFEGCDTYEDRKWLFHEFYPSFATHLTFAFIFPEEAYPNFYPDYKPTEGGEPLNLHLFKSPALRDFISGFYWRMNNETKWFSN